VEQGLAADLENPLELGKGQGIIGERDFVDAVRDRHLSPTLRDRELPVAQQLRGRIEPDLIVSAVCAVLKVDRNNLMKKNTGDQGEGF
jgi:hypothetical protein